MKNRPIASAAAVVVAVLLVALFVYSGDMLTAAPPEASQPPEAPQAGDDRFVLNLQDDDFDDAAEEADEAEHEEHELHMHHRHLEVERMELELQHVRLELAVAMREVADDKVASASLALSRVFEFVEEPGDAIKLLEQARADTKDPAIRRLIRFKLAELFAEDDDLEAAQQQLQALIKGE